MAYATHPDRTFETTWLGQRLVSCWPELGERLATYRRYRKTIEELSHLSDRELADFGMDRHSIRAIAREHVYGRRPRPGPTPLGQVFLSMIERSPAVLMS